MKKKIALFLSHVLVAALAASIAFYIAMPEGSGKLAQLTALIEQYYVDEMDREALEDGAAFGMIDSLTDRWSYYIPRSEYEAYEEQAENAYVGVGMTIQLREDGQGFDIVSVEENGPAYEAGVRTMDILVGAAGQSVLDLNANEVRSLVRGEEGTFVELSFLREGETLTFQVERRRLEITVAEGTLLEEGIGLVVIYNFDDRCASESIAAIEDLISQGATKLIFDVRSNGGGYAHEMVALLDYLLPEGDLFRTVNYKGEETLDTSDAAYLDMPMAVLVNAESYSAAEFFAAALSEYDAAVVVGEKTSGKGYFQNTFRLTDGSAVSLSTGKYYTPQGKCLEGVGITPDVVVQLDEEQYQAFFYGTLPLEDDPQLQAAIRALEENAG